MKYYEIVPCVWYATNIILTNENDGIAHFLVRKRLKEIAKHNTLSLNTKKILYISLTESVFHSRWQYVMTSSCDLQPIP